MVNRGYHDRLRTAERRIRQFERHGRPTSRINIDTGKDEDIIYVRKQKTNRVKKHKTSKKQRK